MLPNIQSDDAKAGDLVELVSPSRKIFIFRLVPGKEIHTHRGIVQHDHLIRKAWGSEVTSHKGNSFFLLQPSLADILVEIPRNTQIMYPKDIGFILVTMGIGAGTKVLEAGSGSGAFTTALAWVVGPEGTVVSYEKRPDVKNLAHKNLCRVGLDDRVTFKLGDISEGFSDKGFDAVFLDLPNAYEHIPYVKQALKPGGYFGCIFPTINQVMRLLPALHTNNFKVVDVCEILLRYYKPVQDRIRPTDRMVAHTGYLTFARSIIPLEKEDDASQGLNSDTDITSESEI